MRRVRVKQWVLLAMRTLLIALLVLAFARPTVRDTSFGRGHGATAGVLLVDRSLSMRHAIQGRTLLDHAKDRAAEALHLFGEGDVVQVFPFDKVVDTGNAGEPTRARSVLASVEATFSPSDVVPALDVARRELRGAEALNRELYLFSDLAQTGWAGTQDPYDGMEGTTLFVVLPPDGNLKNATVSEVGVEGLVLTAGTPARIMAEVENTGNARLNAVTVGAFVADQRIGQTIVGLAPGERSRVGFRFTPRRSGTIELRVELSQDDMVADNVRSRILHVPDRIRAAVVGTERSRYYVEEGLKAIADSVVDAIPYLPGALTDEVLSRADLIILCSTERLGRGEIESIKRRVRAGAGLLILLGDGVDVRLYNEHLLPALQVATITGLEGGRTQRDRFVRFGNVSPHPVLADLIGPDLESPRFFLHYDVKPALGARTILSFTSGKAALVERKVGDGNVLLFASHADQEWSDLPVSGFFAPFLHRTVQYLLTVAYGSEAVAVGDRADRPASLQADRDATLKRPDGRTETVWAQQLGDRSFWVIDDVDTPGVWEIVSSARVIDRFAAQVDTRESDLTRVDEDHLRGLFPGADVVVVQPEDRLSEVVADYRYGYELWRYFVLAAILCVCVELFLMGGESRSRG